MSIIMTTDSTFEREVLQSPVPVLVEFTADWCPPCRMIAPVLHKISIDEADRLRVRAIDVDANPATAVRYQVLGLPTLALFVDGEVATLQVGARGRAAIMREIEPHLRRVAALTAV